MRPHEPQLAMPIDTVMHIYRVAHRSATLVRERVTLLAREKVIQ
ncbi:MAG TPA: hypothetical protein VFK05_24575 [Polyangiaceae bacterium]|nr:hypothetical protein [Polyangiaceae bacterium]